MNLLTEQNTERHTYTHIRLSHTQYLRESWRSVTPPGFMCKSIMIHICTMCSWSKRTTFSCICSLLLQPQDGPESGSAWRRRRQGISACRSAVPKPSVARNAEASPCCNSRSCIIQTIVNYVQPTRHLTFVQRSAHGSRCSAPPSRSTPSRPA